MTIAIVMRISFFVLLLASFAGASPAHAQWNQWRGPLGTGVAPDANPPLRWSESENVQWKTALPGRGHSTPIVVGDHVFVLTAIPTGPELPTRMSNRPGAHDNLPITREHEFVVLALDRNSGEIRWQRKVHQALPQEGGHYTASLASASPVSDGKRLFAYFGSYGLYALDFDGNILWQREFGKMHSKHGHGEGSSPALHGDTLIVNWDHEEQSFLIAVDARDGTTRWRRERDEVTSWSTPLITEVDGKPQVIVCGTDRVRGYDLQSGNVVWECGGLSANIVATPVAADGIVWVGSSYEIQSLMALRITGARGDITDSDRVLWSRSRGTPYVPSPLLYEGALYFLAHYQNVLTRVEAISGDDAPGAMRMGELGNIYASPVGAGGHVYVTDLRGTTMVITNSEIPRVVSVNRLGESISGSAAIADNQIFLRGEKHLYCLQLGASDE